MNTAPDLSAWIERELEVMNRVRAGVGPGLTAPGYAVDRTGLELMKSLMRGETHYVPLADILNFCIVELGENHAVLQATPSALFLNPMGSVHGGWIGTILDSAMSSALMVSLPANCGYLTSSLSIRYVKRLTLETARVRARGLLEGKVGRKTKIHGTLYGPDGVVFAEADGDFRVFPTM